MNKLPDAINRSLTTNYARVPNEVMRDPAISCKAKTALYILLSNKEGWFSTIETLMSMMKEGRTSIQNAVSELETLGYLQRIRYRSIKTKIWVGIFWTYSDTKGVFNTTKSYEKLAENNLEGFVMPTKCPQATYPHVEKPYYGLATCGKPTTNNTIKSNKTIREKNKKKILRPNEKKITQSMFDSFWKIYPRKGGRGGAFTAWSKRCVKPVKDRPTWRDLRKSLAAQKKSVQWQTKKFIPLASTWINQSRWLDDADEMKGFSDKEESIVQYGETWFLQTNGTYANKDGEILR